MLSSHLFKEEKGKEEGGGSFKDLVIIELPKLLKLCVLLLLKHLHKVLLKRLFLCLGVFYSITMCSPSVNVCA